MTEDKAEENAKFDTIATQLVEQNWPLEQGTMQLIKRDYNTVYRAKLTTGELIIVKAKRPK